MAIKELLLIVEDARELLLEDFKTENKRYPREDELLIHVKNLFREKMEDSILGDLSLSDTEYPSDFYKLLLAFAAKH